MSGYFASANTISLFRFATSIQQAQAFILIQRNELMAPNCPVRIGWRVSVSQPRPSAWNSKAEYLRQPTFELNSFKRQLKTFLFAPY